MTSFSVVVASVLFGTTAFLYWMYKKLRAPAYHVGMVSQTAHDMPAIFDDESLYTRQNSNNNKWIMPDHIELFYFEPSVKECSSIPILALHGGPAIAPPEPWKYFQTLPNFYLYHARGCGHSTRPFVQFPTPGKMWPGMKILEETLGIAQQVGDIERIRRRIQHQYYGPKEGTTTLRMHLIGHSFGGFIATLYAAEFPHHVQSLTLLEPAGVMKLPNPESDIFANIQQALQAKSNLQHLQEYNQWYRNEFMDFRTLPQQTETTLAKRQQGFAKHYDRAAHQPNSSSSSERQFPTPPLDMIGGMAAYATYLSMGMEHDYTQACRLRLQHSHFPVLIVHGTEDNMMPSSVSESYQNLFPSQNTTYSILKGANHFVMEHPDCVNLVRKQISMIP